MIKIKRFLKIRKVKTLKAYIIKKYSVNLRTSNIFVPHFIKSTIMVSLLNEICFHASSKFIFYIKYNQKISPVLYKCVNIRKRRLTWNKD